jgi:inorganic pyrophosphatase
VERSHSQKKISRLISFSHILLLWREPQEAGRIKIVLEAKKSRSIAMADFNVIVKPGNFEDGLVNVVVEIPTGSSHKIEWNRELAVFQLDRVEPRIFAKPTNYGFIPQTLDEDGDELDALIITDEPLATGVLLEAKIIGVLKFEDDGEIDDKVIVVPADDRNTGNAINSLEDLPKQLLAQIEHHFTHYKDLKKPGSTVVKGFGDIAEAKEIIRESIERWNKR